MRYALRHGDCRELMAKMRPDSVDAIITDPPYELNFMGKGWDNAGVAFEPATWTEALRIIKPGGHLLAFGGTRTHHRLTCAIEDAGFEVRDCLMWLYGSGFPKSLDVSKALDKAAGAEATDIARQWDGWGTALKPAWEPIILARKPLSERNVAANVARWGTGALNIGVTRIEAPGGLTPGGRHVGSSPNPMNRAGDIQENRDRSSEHPAGRWPANFVLSCDCPDVTHLPGFCPVAMLDVQSGERKSNSGKPFNRNRDKFRTAYGTFEGRRSENGFYGDAGGASRFFYCAKASRAERDAGLGDMPEVACGMMEDDNYPIKTGSGNLRATKRRNPHPTVKPVALLRYLTRLVTPPNGVVLDPFMGSGSTGLAVLAEGGRFVGFELQMEYLKIAQGRLP